MTLESIELEVWYELGKLMGADEHLLGRMRQSLENQGEVINDVFSEMSPLKVAIFTLREHTARRAVEKLLPRNRKFKYVVCTDDELTVEAKSHVKSADIVVIVTTCLSHAIFYGIQSYLKDNVVYPRSSGTTGIVAVLEDYIKRKSG